MFHQIADPILVRHPAPEATESMYGYLLRLTETNGYTTPWTIFSIAGIPQNHMRPCALPLFKIARIAHRDVAELKAIAYCPTADLPRIPHLLGHRVRLTDLGLRSPKICPLCIKEMGFIEAHWDLAFMIACPIHRCRSTAHCRRCHRPLSWFRRGLLECVCGASLTQESTGHVSGPICNLLDIIRRCILGLTLPEDHPLGPAAKPLGSMTVLSLLRVIGFLGSLKLRAKLRPAGAPGNENPDFVISAAAEVLDVWPDGYFKLLRRIGEASVKRNGRSGVVSQFEDIYGLFKAGVIAPSSSAEFFKKSFLEFATSHWEHSVVDRRLTKALGVPASKGSCTKTDVARYLNVTPTTAKRILANHNVPRRIGKQGNRKVILYDIRGLGLREYDREHLIRLRVAAKEIGISGRVLATLKANGLYVSRLPVEAGYDISEVAEFKNRLLSLSDGSQNTAPKCEWVTLGQIMHSDSASDVFAAVLTHQLSVLGSSDGTVQGLLIARADFVRVRSESRARFYGNARTPTEVANEIGCSPGAVPGLISLGLLRGKEVPTGVRVFEESIADFKRQFVCLSVIAKRLHTLSKWLARDCERLNIQVIRLPRVRVEQLLVRISDAQRLVQYHRTGPLALPHQT